MPYVDPHAKPAGPFRPFDGALRLYGQEMRSLNAWERHQKLMHDYQYHFKSAVAAAEAAANRLPTTTDLDALRDNHRFVVSPEESLDRSTPEKRMALTYYDRLFKEYVLADFSRYKEDQIGMRWRIEAEVVTGKGTCAL